MGSREMLMMGLIWCTTRWEWAVQWENVLKVLQESFYWSWTENNQMHSHSLSLEKETCGNCTLWGLWDPEMPDTVVGFCDPVCPCFLLPKIHSGMKSRHFWMSKQSIVCQLQILETYTISNFMLGMLKEHCSLYLTHFICPVTLFWKVPIVKGFKNKSLCCVTKYVTLKQPQIKPQLIFPPNFHIWICVSILYKYVCTHIDTVSMSGWDR